ncbi:MAG TPA: LysR family transcriptional regulator [Solirubrobacteraceae bacterium]|nr:LysR family transcriptional regulator [Solirubrobacteraceae bacterium]
MLDLRRLRYFVAVAESRSFSRAAEQLLVAQSAVSRQVRQLERELGVQLLARSTHDVQLTAAGAAVWERGTVLLRDADGLWDVAHGFAAGVRGSLAIGYSISLGYETAPALIGAVRQRLPEITIAATVLPSPGLVEAVVRGEVDLGLARCALPDVRLRSDVVRRERLGLVVRADHRLANGGAVEPLDFRDEPLWLHDREANPGHYDLIVGVCRSAGFEPRIAHRDAPFDQSFGVVAGGAAVAVVGESAAAGLPAGLRYVPLRVRPRIEVTLLSHPDETRPHMLRTRRAICDAAVVARWIASAA